MESFLESLFPTNPVLLQWVRNNYPDAECIMSGLNMMSELGSVGMMRHQVRDVSRATGIPTKDLAEYCRLVYEIMSKDRLRITLVEINMYGIQDGCTLLCQVEEDDGPYEVVERIYVKDLLDKHGIIYQEI
jgi:hypothetical protein